MVERIDRAGVAIHTGVVSTCAYAGGGAAIIISTSPHRHIALAPACSTTAPHETGYTGQNRALFLFVYHRLRMEIF
ncbi:hypothetical protein V5P93_003442 [Actinokineospora auranticolor]|uniref:hypothetical protein n=1 Tax=Actinokineospora auranticolor TaxID=155976 RepID=UPI0011B02900|nr:hypothetical protein [Actinokineospora auranticolor]